MDKPRGALIVSYDGARAARWGVWLEQAGFFTTTCPGLYLSNQCPRFNGEPCPRRELVEVAVVDLDSAEPAQLCGDWAQRTCTKLPDDGSTVFVHGPEHAGRFRDDQLHATNPSFPAALVAPVFEAWRRNAASGRGERELRPTGAR